jgi:hypothetical protein
LAHADRRLSPVAARDPTVEARHAVLVLTLLVTAVMAVRGAVALVDGDVGTVARQVAVGGFVLAFGVALVRRWETLG